MHVTYQLYMDKGKFKFKKNTGRNQLYMYIMSKLIGFITQMSFKYRDFYLSERETNISL